MPADEFEAWRDFYTLYPFDDYHRYHRPAAMIYAAHPRVTQKSDQIDAALKWLFPDPVIADVPDSDVRTLAAFGLKLPGQR